MQVNMGGSDQVHHHGILAGLGAGAAAVLLIPMLVFAVWRHVAGQMSLAVQVIVWALTAAVVAAVTAGMVYAFLFLRHRIRNPETLARPAFRAEVLEPPAPAPLEIPSPPAVAELPPGGMWRPSPRAATPEPDSTRKRT